MNSRRPSAGTVVRIGSLVTVAFMGSVIVTPLYALYQAKFGFSEITLTLVYAVYVVGNVAALLLFGQISDQIGRKRVALPALGAATASALVFLFAQGTAWLFAGRLLIGVAVGVLSGTATAWLAERYSAEDQPVATVASATANLLGIAIGPALGGLLAEYVTEPLRTPLIAYLVILAVVTIGIVGVRDVHEPRVERLRDVRVHPRVGVPAERLRAFTPPAITGFVTFAVGGLYFALIPSVAAQELHQSNLAVGGLIVTELAAIAAALIVLGRDVRPPVAMTTGLCSLVPAVILVVVAQATESLPLLLLATVFAAVSLSLGYRGSLQIVNEIAPPDRRAEVVSTYYIACFVGNAVPVIGLGILTTLSTRMTASISFAAVIAALSLGALAGSRR